MLQVKEVSSSSFTVQSMREAFERTVNRSPLIKKSHPLGTMEINGKFSYYINEQTQSMWLGFALGMREAERAAPRSDRTPVPSDHATSGA